MPVPVKATIFSYQVGFGDCFLLRYSYDDGQRRHMLIDFGTTGLPEGAAASYMSLIAKDIAGKCTERRGDGLDVVVATHRHADHISGFATRDDGKGSGDIIAALKPKVVVLPWTEAPEAPEDWLGPEDSGTAQAFESRRQSLQAMHETAALAVAFARDPKTKLPLGLAGEMGFIGEVNLANLSAVKNLQAMGEAAEHRYVFHGCDIKLGNILPEITIDVLGPPTLVQTESIRKQASRNRDEFWMLQPKRFAAATGPTKKQSLFPNAPSAYGTKLFTEQRWLGRRIDELQAELTLSLVRDLDKQMNNTSVVLLMRAGSKSLLFPGDAQLENWQYALQSPLATLLDDVDVYKVGHHGSLNATPRSMWKRFLKRGDQDHPHRLTSVLSTKLGKHGSVAKETEVPRRTLVQELEKNSNFFTTEALPPDKLYHEVDIAL
ncbi:hypothetical protein IE4872_PC00030 (plasmid) [Rhizobium gallicum]|uniref:Metallo-beta-lactamase domain-containing protein n=1 Tax=Rhizobium gallicum TaxID=56730 RepID=A0A1L5NQ92_9HYPH|nr:hypothetical protein [Rhizobium gallicum]APO70063.1 hypothetical protein IE4872_PC00030 [Rhizobium gallicum]